MCSHKRNNHSLEHIEKYMYGTHGFNAQSSIDNVIKLVMFQKYFNALNIMFHNGKLNGKPQSMVLQKTQLPPHSVINLIQS